MCVFFVGWFVLLFGSMVSCFLCFLLLVFDELHWLLFFWLAYVVFGFAVFCMSTWVVFFPLLGRGALYDELLSGCELF